MTRKKFVFIFICAFALLDFRAPLNAQEGDVPVQTPSSFVVVGAAALPEFEGSDRFRPVPLIISRFDAFGASVELEGLEGRIDLLKSPVWRAGPAFGVILPRNDSFVDEPAVLELPSVDTALELGAYIGFRTSHGNLREGTLSGAVTVRHDALGGHNGLTVDGEIEYFFAVNRMLRIGTAANASFASDDYFDTYFSVEAASSMNSGLDPFEASGAARDVGAEIFSILSFSPRWGVFGRVAYNRLLGDAADSSIAQEAGSPNQVFFGLGVFRGF